MCILLDHSLYRFDPFVHLMWVGCGEEIAAIGSDEGETVRFLEGLLMLIGRGDGDRVEGDATFGLSLEEMDEYEHT